VIAGAMDSDSAEKMIGGEPPSLTPAQCVRRLIEFIGDDPSREGLENTPERHLRYLREFTSPEDFEFTTFENEGGSDMIVQTRIPFFSICEHHLLPFFGMASIGYIPRGQIVGLSKLARAVDFHSRALQNQERITSHIEEAIAGALDPEGIAVVLEARHLCMEMRGIKKAGAITTTSRMTGAFFDNPQTRAEFFKIIDRK
jgi:GTP cyclohydrolase I